MSDVSSSPALSPPRQAAARPTRLESRERWALAMLAVSGAVFLPGALNRFVFPKLTLAAVAVALAATVPARGRLPRAAALLVFAGAFVLVAAALTGTMPAAQLIGRAPRYEGALVLTIYTGAGVAGARLLGSGRARGSTALFLRCLAVASIAIAIEAVLETAGLRPLSSSVSRPGSLLGNASDEGAWAVLALGPLAAVALRAREPLFVAGVIGAATAVVCSGSRGALTGAAATAVVLGALAPRRAMRAAVAGGAVCLLVAALALPATRARVTGSSEVAVETVRGRLLLWGETLRLLEAHPLLGVGPSGYLDAIPEYHTATYERKVGPANPPDSPHDWILQSAAAGGLALLVLAFALAGLTLRAGLRSVAAQPTGGESAAVGGMLAGLAGYGTALLFHFTSPGTTPLAAVLAGALLAGSPSRSTGSRSRLDQPGRGVARWGQLRRSARWGAIALALALAVAMAAGAVAELPLRSAILAAASDRLPAADRDFRAARALRPWDADVAATAAHAYATLAEDGIAVGIAPGLRWAREELLAYPSSIQALSDTAVLELASGRPALAAPLLVRARRLDPANPNLKRLGALERQSATGLR